MEFTEEQRNQIINTKAYFPYRIVFGVILPDGTFEVYANYTKHKMNRFARLGYPVIMAN
jgi:hypothetical protein